MLIASAKPTYVALVKVLEYNAIKTLSALRAEQVKPAVTAWFNAAYAGHYLNHPR